MLLYAAGMPAARAPDSHCSTAAGCWWFATGAPLLLLLLLLLVRVLPVGASLPVAACCTYCTSIGITAFKQVHCTVSSAASTAIAASRRLTLLLLLLLLLLLVLLLLLLPAPLLLPAAFQGSPAK
jgi:hypothetical protein